ncbi:MAG: site-specific DNA-methyltransferase [Alphaproteobacteria bacterium]
MSLLSISYCSPGDLHPRKRNPRTHSKKQIQQIADSIKRFGFTVPVLVDGTNVIIAGHGRVEAAKLLNMPLIPILRREDLSEAEIRAYVIADNRLAEQAGWDRELLALEFIELEEIAPDLDLTVTGFDAADIDVLINEQNASNNLGEQIPAVKLDSSAITNPGDLWLIGPHKLFCGDATKPESYERLLAGAKADLVFTDPPYNVPIQGHVSGLGQTQHREFAMASGEMTSPEFTSFLSTVFNLLVEHSTDGSIHYICIDWRHLGEMVIAGSAYSEVKNMCVWVKTNGGMGSLYRSQHECVFVFKNGTAAHINNVELGKHGRNRTNVWTYAGANSFGKDRMKDLASHPTVKPVSLVADAILDCSNRGGIVLDPFCGSGTTLVAAEKTGRAGYGIELDPAYCDVIIERLIAMGLDAVHAETGRKFTDMRDEEALLA